MKDPPNSGRQSGAGEGSEPADSRSQQGSEDQSASSRAEPADSSGAQQPSPQDVAESSSTSPPERRSNESTPGAQSQPGADAAPQPSESDGETGTPPRSIREMFTHPRVTNALQPLQTVVGSLGNVLKLAFYAVVALAIAYFIWIKRSALAQALADILRELREFFARLLGGPPAIEDQPAGASGPGRRSFSDFSDPFVSGRARSLPPVELVRYTFEAFEAWAGDHGRPRSLDQTPQELVRGVLPPQTPMYDQARRLAQLYSEAAYSAATVSREAASGLQSLWQGCALK